MYLLEDETMEETGWKLVHGDVFRPPKYPRLLCSMIGSGIQLFCCTGIVIGECNTETGWPHPGKKSLNSRLVIEILEKSLNFCENFGKSLKSPWIFKMILEILEFWDFSNRHRYAAWGQKWKYVTNPRVRPLNCGLSVEFWHPWKSWKDPWNILEWSLNFVFRISSQFVATLWHNHDNHLSIISQWYGVFNVCSISLGIGSQFHNVFSN